MAKKVSGTSAASTSRVAVRPCAQGCGQAASRTSRAHRYRCNNQDTAESTTAAITLRPAFMPPYVARKPRWGPGPQTTNLFGAGAPNDQPVLGPGPRTTNLRTHE